MLTDYIMNSQKLLQAPITVAIIPSGVVGKPSVCGALYITTMATILETYNQVHAGVSEETVWFSSDTQKENHRKHQEKCKQAGISAMKLLEDAGFIRTTSENGIPVFELKKDL